MCGLLPNRRHPVSPMLACSTSGIVRVPSRKFYRGLPFDYFPPRPKYRLIMTANILISRAAQSRTCPWVSADPLFGEVIGKVPGTNPSSRYSGHPGNARTSKATTVRAFLFSPGFPTAGVTEEAHHHCRKCGRDLPPIHGRQSRIFVLGRTLIHLPRV